MKKSVLFFLSIMIYLTLSVCYAKNDSDLLLNLKDCATLSNNNTRLTCFDKLVPRHTEQQVVEAIAIVPSIVDKKLAEQNKVNDFAKEHLKKTKSQQRPSSLFATISKVKQLLRGQWVIYLKNGQKWQQTDTASINFKVGNKIRLDKGAMGAIYLYKEGSQRNIKVKRLK